MNTGILALFAGVIAAAKTGEYKAAVCQGGQLLSSVTCDTPAALMSSSEPGAAPLTGEQFKSNCDEFCAELRKTCDHSDKLVKTGMASNTALAPGTWLAFATFLIQALQAFLPALLNPAPAPAPVPPVA